MNNTYKFTSINNLNNPGTTFSYCGKNGTICSDIKGIKRLMMLTEESFSLAEGFVSDKIIGKAAALIMVYLSAKSVYGETVSVSALDILKRYGVDVSYKYLVPAIINRKGDDICPMEKTVLGTDIPKEAVELLKIKLKSMA